MLFANPPYSEPNLSLFVPRARHEAERGVASSWLVPASTSSKWFSSIWAGATPIGERTVDVGPLRGKHIFWRAPGIRRIETVFLSYRLIFNQLGRPADSARGWSARGASVLVHFLQRGAP
jgi:hypothetical protein